MLVVGTGQSGAQIAEDLHLAGRQVHLAVGSAPRVARFYRGRDCMTWLADMGLYDRPAREYPGGQGRHREDQPLRHRSRRRSRHRPARLRRRGHAALRHARSTAGTRPAASLRHCAPHSTTPTRSTTRSAPTSTPTSSAEASARPRARRAGTSRCGNPTPRPLPWTWLPRASPASSGRSATGRTTGGSRRAPSTAAAARCRTAASPRCRGCSFVGLPWMHTWGSGRFLGIDRDAAHLAATIVAAHRDPASHHPADQPTALRLAVGS